MALPVFAAPVGAMTLHYGDKYDDLAYNDILVPACAEAGIAAFTGDGTDPAVMEGAAAAIAKNGGCGVPTVKPWNLETIRQKMDLVKAADPFAIAMDIDAAGLPFLKNMTPARRQQDCGGAARDRCHGGEALHRQGHHDRGRGQEGSGGRGQAASWSPTTAAGCWISAPPPPRCCPPSWTRWAAR